MQAFAGFKLMGDKDDAGTSLLAVDKASHERANSYGEIGVTGKVKINNNTLHVGTLGPQFPVFMSSSAVYSLRLIAVYIYNPLKSKI
nr:OprD family outer membrane porin [Acinetobacter pullicarnis]